MNVGALVGAAVGAFDGVELGVPVGVDVGDAVVASVHGRGFIGEAFNEEFFVALKG